MEERGEYQRKKKREREKHQLIFLNVIIFASAITWFGIVLFLSLRRHQWLKYTFSAGYFPRFSDHERCSLPNSSLEVRFTPSPIFIATTFLSIVPPRHSSAYSSWTTSHFIRCFIRKGRKKWDSSKWLSPFAAFFVLPQKAFLHLSWHIQAQSKETPPVNSSSTPFTGIHSEWAV